MDDRELPKTISPEDWEAVFRSSGFVGSCQPFDYDKWREYLIAQQGDPGTEGFSLPMAGLEFARAHGTPPVNPSRNPTNV